MKIILLHGALGAADQLKPLADELKALKYKPVILELPGHGDTPLGNNDFTIEGFSNWLDHTMDDQNLWGHPFFGFSMGGYIMLYLLSQHERNVKTVITLGSKFGWSKESSVEEARRLDPVKILEKVPKYAQMLDRRHSDWQGVLANTKDLMNRLGEKPLLNEASVKDITTRALIMRGEPDQMVNEDESVKMAQWLKSAKYEALPGISHPLEQVPPIIIAQKIHNFILYDQN